MKITFKVPIAEGDITRTGVTCDHLIIHFPQEQIVSNNVSGGAKMLSFSGLRDVTKAAQDAYLALLAEDMRGECEEGAATARVNAKQAAAKAEKSVKP